MCCITHRLYLHTVMMIINNSVHNLKLLLRTQVFTLPD